MAGKTKNNKRKPKKNTKRYRKPSMFPKPRVESKYYTKAISNGPGTGIASPTIIPLSEVPLGIENGEHIGVQISCKSLNTVAVIENTSTTTAGRTRLVIIVDKECQIAYPSITDMYDTSTLAFVEGSQRNLDNLDRFVVLYDKMRTISQPTSADADARQIHKIYKKLNFTTSFIQGSDKPRQNAIYMVWSSTTGTNSTIDYSSRLKFTDN